MRAVTGDTRTDQFTYTVRDQLGATAIATLNIAVAGSAIGNAGANIFWLTGSGTMASGLGGNDLYYVDKAGDMVLEGADAGTDRVAASSSYALQAGQHIEVLQTTAAAGTAAINLTGNEFGQVIIGNSGANVLNGGLGSDILTSNAGADTFVFDSALGANNIDRTTDFVASTAVPHDTIHLDTDIFTAAGAPGILDEAAFRILGIGEVARPTGSSTSSRLVLFSTTRTVVALHSPRSSSLLSTTRRR